MRGQKRRDSFFGGHHDPLQEGTNQEGEAVDAEVGSNALQVSLPRTSLSRSSQSRFTYRRLTAGPEVLTVLRSPASSSRSKFALINPRVMASQQSRVRLSRRAGTPWGARP